MEWSNYVKRCIIFFFYDKDGIVDRYVFNMLNDLKTSAERIVFMCNGKLAPQSRDKLESLGVEPITRENKGLDVWAYKESLEYLGWDTVGSYDEVVMMNFTIFPTTHSFENMFREMDREDVDFWGATMYFTGLTAVAGIVPDHINSHFIAVRRSMLKSAEFRNYWENMPEIKDYKDSVGYHETQFTRRFSEYGFRYKVYAPSEELRNITDCTVYWNLRYVMENTNLPFVKRKSFFYPPYDGFLAKAYGEAAADAFNFLQQHKDYDSDAIWENILRTASLSEIKNAMQLNCILPRAGTVGCSAIDSRIGVMLYSRDFAHAEIFRNRFEKLPRLTEIHIFSPQEPSEEFLEALGKFKPEFHKTADNADPAYEILSYLSESGREYEYILSLRADVHTIEDRAAAEKAFDCLIPSRDFVSNVVNKFTDEPRLGMLFPPPAYTRDDSRYLCREWSDNKDDIIRIAKHLNVPINEHAEPPAPYAGMFWCSNAAMRSILEIWNSLPGSLRRPDADGRYSLNDSIMSIMAQKAGFYSAWLMSEATAAIEITNMYYLMNKLINSVYGNNGLDIWQIAGKIRTSTAPNNILEIGSGKKKHGLFGRKNKNK